MPVYTFTTLDDLRRPRAGTLAGTFARGINLSGQIVGNFSGLGMTLPFLSSRWTCLLW